MSAHKSMAPADRIARATSEAVGGDARYATAHALIAVAETLAALYTPEWEGGDETQPRKPTGRHSTIKP